jgi:hypothetical protein
MAPFIIRSRLVKVCPASSIRNSWTASDFKSGSAETGLAADAIHIVAEIIGGNLTYQGFAA